MSTTVLSTIYWSICVPIFTFGCEILPFSEIARNKFDCTHWEMCKNIQYLPPQTANPCVLNQLGWSSLNGYIDRLKLYFVWKILEMRTPSVIKAVTVKKITHWISNVTVNMNSPICYIMKVAKKYDLVKVIIDKMIGKNNLSVHQFKCLVKERISMYESKQHQVSWCMYKGIDVYKKCFRYCKKWQWFIHASRYPETRNQCGTLLRFITGLERDKLPKHCICKPNELLDISHIIFECNLTSEVRQKFLLHAKNVIPEPFFNSFANMDTHGKTDMVLHGLGDKYVPELSECYWFLLTYFYHTYMAFRNSHTLMCD